MKLRLALLTLLICCLTAPAIAQWTVANAQVLDPTGIAYQNCKFSVDFVNENTTPGAPPPTLSGSKFQTSYVGFNCDGFGRFKITLPDNNVIQPQPSQWSFSICDQTGKYCFQHMFTITGGSIDLTSQIQSVSVPLPPPSVSGVSSVGPATDQGLITNFATFGFNNQTTTPNLTVNEINAPAYFVWGNSNSSPGLPNYTNITGAMLPFPTLTSLGGVQAIDCSIFGANYVIQKITNTGTGSCLNVTGGSGGVIAGNQYQGVLYPTAGSNAQVGPDPNVTSNATTWTSTHTGGMIATQLSTNGSGAGVHYLAAGTAKAIVASNVGVTAPTSVTGYNFLYPTAAPTTQGFLFGTNTSNIVTTAWVCAGANAGDLCYYNGTNWVLLTGNASGTAVLSETSAGVPSWSSSLGSTSFTNITSGVNTGANTLTCGTGCILTTSDTGKIIANIAPNSGMLFSGSGIGSAVLVNPGSGSSNWTVNLPVVAGTLAETSQLAQTLAAISHNFLTGYTATTGLFTQAQPAFSDISGTAGVTQGGTGLSSPVAHEVMIGQNISTYTQVAMPVDSFLQGQGSSVDPSALTMSNCNSPTVSLGYSTSTHTFPCLTTNEGPITTACGSANTVLPCKVALVTGNTGTVSATTMVTPASSGQFQICGALVETISGTATLALNSIYNNGVTTRTIATANLTFASNGTDAGGCYPFYATASNAIQFSITGTIASGAYEYILWVTQKQ